MKQLDECAICGEYRHGTFYKGGDICFNCSPYGENRQRLPCFLCWNILPGEMHHVYGRKNSSLEVVPLCCNCHRAEDELEIIKPLFDYLFSLRIEYFLLWYFIIIIFISHRDKIFQFFVTNAALTSHLKGVMQQ